MTPSMTSISEPSYFTDVTVLILAAGRGERFSASGGTGHKLDAKLADRSVIEHVMSAVEAAGLNSYLVRPESSTGGIGESIALGVSSTAQAKAWLILPGDLPLIKPCTIRRVAEALIEYPIVMPVWRRVSGHPVGFQGSYFHELVALNGDVGAARIVRANRLQGRVLDLQVDDVGICIDVDTCHDLSFAQHLLEIRQRPEWEGKLYGGS